MAERPGPARMATDARRPFRICCTKASLSIHRISPMLRAVLAFAALATFVGSAPLIAQNVERASSGVSTVGTQPVTPVVLAPGDAVRITVWRKPELSGEFQVSADGTLADPYYMSIRVAGVPFDAVSQQIRSVVEQTELNPRVLVEPLLRVSVGGEVRQPNVHTFAQSITVAQAVMMSGGPTERARMNRVRLVRDGRATTVDLTNPQIGLAQTQIRSGDHIMVGRSTNVIRDYVAPISSVLGAAVSIAYIVTRYF